MKRRRAIWNAIADRTDLQEEPYPAQPVLELYGDQRILIEHHRGVTEYGREKITVRMRYGYLCICGCGLEVAKMTSEHLVITGRIDTIGLMRGR